MTIMIAFTNGTEKVFNNVNKETIQREQNLMRFKYQMMGKDIEVYFNLDNVTYTEGY